MQIKNDIKVLLDTVVEGGYCIGCGNCAAVNGSPLKMNFDELKMYKASFDKEVEDARVDQSILEICPFSGKSLDENQLGEMLYSSSPKRNDEAGYYEDAFAGYVTEGEFREEGSSGGFGNWIVSELLKQDLVDYVVHVKALDEVDEKGRLFKYQISSTLDEVKKGAKSKYYPIELSEVIPQIREKEGRYVVVGVPCFIKAVRLMSEKDPILRDRIKFCLGLMCGHLKSGHFASMWSWQLGIKPKDLKWIDFRTKLKEYGANDYGVTVCGLKKGKNTKIVSPPTTSMFGGNWGWGFFKYKACEFCDDVTAETADLVVGDAWIDELKKDYKGTNITILRNKQIVEIFNKAIEEGRIYKHPLSMEKVIATQRGGFADRRGGTSYRLFVEKEKGNWVPERRVKPSDNIPKKRKYIYDLRMKMSRESHQIFQEAIDLDDFNYFRSKLSSMIVKYNEFYRLTFKDKIKLKYRIIKNKFKDKLFKE